MPDFKTFHESLENDLTRLAHEIKGLGASGEGAPKAEREIVRRSIEKITGGVASESTPSVSPPVSEPPTSVSPLPNYLARGGRLKPEVRYEIERLIDLVFHESLEKAVKEAKRHPPFVLDAFHDALTDKLIPILVERGILK